MIVEFEIVWCWCCFCFFEDLVGVVFFVAVGWGEFGEELGYAAVDGGEKGGGSRDGAPYGGFLPPAPAVSA